MSATSPRQANQNARNRERRIVTDALLHGTTGFWLAYGSVAAAFLASLVWRRALVSAWQLLTSLGWAAGLTIVLGVLLSLAHAAVPGLAHSGTLIQVAFGLMMAAVVGHAGAGISLRRGSRAGYVRGAVVRQSEAPRLPPSRRGDPFKMFRRGLADKPPVGGRLTVAGIPVAPADETKHFKIIGTTGTGKSTAIRELLGGALARGDRAVIADPDGGFLSTFHDAARGDVILSPFHPGSVRWQLGGEILGPPDVDQMARSLIPDHGHADRVWAEYARTLFVAVVQQLLAAKQHDQKGVLADFDRRVYETLRSVSRDALRKLLADSVAAPFLEKGNEEMFGSVRSVAVSAVRVLEYIIDQKGPPFSVRQWVRERQSVHDGGRGGVLFIPYKAGEIAALRSIISAWMRMAIFEGLDQPEGDQRLWFVVDELDALGEIDGLKDALARLRKFGGRCVLGFQSIAQVSGTYGKAAADTIVENCGNTLILRCSASEQGGTSQFASRLIGQREVVYRQRSWTRRPSEWMPSTTYSEQLRVEPAVMASEIERLPDLEGLLKLASVPDWRAVRLGGQSGRRSPGERS